MARAGRPMLRPPSSLSDFPGATWPVARQRILPGGGRWAEGSPGVAGPRPCWLMVFPVPRGARPPGTRSEPSWGKDVSVALECSNWSGSNQSWLCCRR